MLDYTIVTVCNRIPIEPYYCLAEFVKSVDDAPIVVLGTNVNEYKGLGSKPKLLYKAIKDGVIKTKYVIFTDCFDLVFQDKPEYTIYKFIEQPYKADLVISSERNCFPADLKDEYDKLPCNTSYKYLNSGFIVGYTSALYEALEAMDLDNVPDDYRNKDGSMTHINDQFLWQQIFLKQPVKIALDTETIFSNALHSVTLSELDFEKEFIRNKETGNIPHTLHMNGSAKTDGLREPILNHLNLI